MLYRPTELLRATLTMEARALLTALEDAPEGSYREVQLSLPDGEPCFFAVDRHPEEIALDRKYLLPPFYPSRDIRFRLLPGQFLIGATGKGMAECGMIVEYHRS